MDGFLAFKYLHIVSMFFAVALAVSGDIVIRRVAATRDARAIRVVTGRVRPLANLSTILFLAGVAFGIVAALTGQIDLLAPWLILAYVAFLTAMAIGITIADPWVSRLEAASAGSPDGTPSESLQAVIDDPRARAGTWALMLLVATLVFLMVVKPFA
ncbi:MAG TPA: hypothetical protein VHK28_01510 [Candidatus Limnocylindria bacterium]|nr:hypothetical protein [Candidatus Limnocylindria bacterium]